MLQPLDMLIQIAGGVTKQFGQDCEVVIHDLTADRLEHAIFQIKNGQVANRQTGERPSIIVQETLQKDPDSLEDRLGYLTRTSDGRVLKTSTLYIRGEDRKIHYILSINYDISGLITVDRALKSLIDTEPQSKNKQPDQTVCNVNDLLDTLIEQSVRLVGKPVALMNKEDKVTAIKFLNDAGAFLITKSGDKVSRRFGISKFTLYSYLDTNKEAKHEF